MASWHFDINSEILQHLSEGERVQATYRIKAADDSGFTAADGHNEVNQSYQDITITITGTNDQPFIHVDHGDSDTEQINETNAGINTSGTLTATHSTRSSTSSVCADRGSAVPLRCCGAIACSESSVKKRPAVHKRRCEHL